MRDDIVASSQAESENANRDAAQNEPQEERHILHDGSTASEPRARVENIGVLAQLSTWLITQMAYQSRICQAHR